MDIPKKLYAIYPTQQGRPFVDYFNEVTFHYIMIAHQQNQKEVFDNINTKNIFILNLNHSYIIITEVNRDCHSSDQHLANNARMKISTTLLDKSLVVYKDSIYFLPIMML